MTCIHCGSTDLPLGRPRKDGSRWPMRYCRACLTAASVSGTTLLAGRRAAKTRATRTYRQRHAVGERVLLGPCPCRDCKADGLVYLAGTAKLGRWVEPDGRRHWCGRLAG